MAEPRGKSRAYHHGDLRQALLDEAERLLEAEGIQALSLRAMARAVGVTHAAPANHFGDLTGLLSELAADGYRRFGAALERAMDAAGAAPRDRAMAVGRAYVGFAAAHPGLFALMFRSERLDAQRPALKAAIAGSAEVLRRIVVAHPAGDRLPAPEMVARMTALWALVHGYAVLMLDGRLKRTLASLPGRPGAEDFFTAVLGAVQLGPPPKGSKP